MDVISEIVKLDNDRHKDMTNKRTKATSHLLLINSLLDSVGLFRRAIMIINTGKMPSKNAILPNPKFKYKALSPRIPLIIGIDSKKKTGANLNRNNMTRLKKVNVKAIPRILLIERHNVQRKDKHIINNIFILPFCSNSFIYNVNSFYPLMTLGYLVRKLFM